MPEGGSIAEQLVACLAAGTVLDLLPDVPQGTPLTVEEMRDWDERHDLDADLLRDLLLGRLAVVPDPRGLRVRGVRIRGRLDLDLVRSPVLLAIHDGLLDEGVSADQARIPDLTLRGCHITHPRMIALDLDRVQVEGSVYLNRSHVTASTHEGAVRLVDARIGGNLFCGHTVVRNTDGPGLLAHGLRAERDLFFDPGFVAEGHGEIGAIGMNDARIGARLIISGAILRNPTGPALSLDGLQTTRGVHLDDGFTADGSGAEATIRLTGARIGGTLHLTDATVTSRSAPEHRWALDGLTYAAVPRLAVQGNRAAWLDLLRTGMQTYAAQPYQQLAAAYRAEGHDSDVRAILIAQRRDQIARGGLPRIDLWWARFTGVLLGYGYQPWRALLYLLGVLAVSVVLAVVLGAAGGLTQSPAPDTAAHLCAVIDMVGRGLDLGTPFLPKANSAACATTSAPAGVALTVTDWILQLVAWALAALFVAGFTGIVRKT